MYDPVLSKQAIKLLTEEGDKSLEINGIFKKLYSMKISHLEC